MLGRIAPLAVCFGLTASGLAGTALAQPNPSADLQACGLGDRNPRTAVPACTRLIGTGQLKPHALPVVHAKRGFAFQQQGRYKEAIADYDRVIALKPNDRALLAEVYHRRGWLYTETRQPQRGVADLTRAIAFKIKHLEWRSHLARGHAYMRLSNYRSASADFSRSLAMYKNNPDAYNGRARANLHAGDLKAALADANAAVKLAPRVPYIWYTRAQINEKSGNKQGAIRDYRQAYKLSPGNRGVVQALARLGAKP